MWKEFKEFAFKGNVLDMAVGVIIGGAFGKIVSSLVNDIIMPFFGWLTAGVQFSDLKWVFGAKPEDAIMYGNFIQNIVDFLIIAFSIFIFIKVVNNAKFRIKPEQPVEDDTPAPPTQEELLTEIRDLLAEREASEPEKEPALID